MPSQQGEEAEGKGLSTPSGLGSASLSHTLWNDLAGLSLLRGTLGHWSTGALAFGCAGAVFLRHDSVDGGGR